MNNSYIAFIGLIITGIICNNTISKLKTFASINNKDGPNIIDRKKKTPKNGDIWFDDINNKLYVYSCINGWIVFNPETIPGPTGPTGPSGPTGPIGPTGNNT